MLAYSLLYRPLLTLWQKPKTFAGSLRPTIERFPTDAAERHLAVSAVSLVPYIIGARALDQ
jgi:hypothetical protein